MGRFRDFVSSSPYARESDHDRNKARNRYLEIDFYRKERARRPVADYHLPSKQTQHTTPIADQYSQARRSENAHPALPRPNYVYETPSTVARAPVPPPKVPTHDFEPNDEDVGRPAQQRTFEDIRRTKRSGTRTEDWQTVSPKKDTVDGHISTSQPQRYAVPIFSTLPRTPYPEPLFGGQYGERHRAINDSQTLDHIITRRAQTDEARADLQSAPDETSSPVETITRDIYNVSPVDFDPRPIKDSTPSRLALLSPRKVRKAVSNKFRRSKREADIDNHASKLSCENIAAVPPEAGLGPCDDIERIPSMAISDLGTNGENMVTAVSSTMDDGPLHDESLHAHKTQTTDIEGGTTVVAQGVPDKLAADDVDATPRNFLDLSPDLEDDVAEVEGDDTAFLPSNRDTETARAQNDLYELCKALKTFAPGHPGLSQCRSAGKATSILRTLYTEAIDGWETQYLRAERLDRIAGGVDELRKRTQELETRNEFLELKNELLDRIKEQNIQLESENTRLRSQHKVALDQQAQEYERTIGNDRKVLAELNRECATLRQGHESLRQTANDSQLEAGRQGQEVRRLQEIVRSSIERSEAESRKHLQDRERLIHDHRGVLAALEANQANDTKMLRKQIADFDTRMAAVQAEHGGIVEELHSQHRSAQESLQATQLEALRRKDEERKDAEKHLDEFYREELAKKDRALQRMRDGHSSEMRNQEMRHEAEMTRLREEISRLRADAHNVENRARQEYLEKEQKLKASHLAQVRKVTQQREDLYGALVQRDAFKGMSDRELETRFKKLAKAIDQFSRTCVAWDTSKESTWPIPNRTLKTHENPRQLKQYVVQNLLWTTLYESVFYMPFKPFGIDGDGYFQGWTDSFGENLASIVAPHWPEPGENCEKWRFETVEKCVTTVETTSGDPILKRAYVDGLQRVCDALISSLDRIVADPRGFHKSVKDIVHQATKLWLDIGMQRCRVMIVVPSECRGAKNDGRVARQLIVQPELQRVGNAEGGHLNMPEVIVSKMEVFPLSTV